MEHVLAINDLLQFHEWGISGNMTDAQLEEIAEEMDNRGGFTVSQARLLQFLKAVRAALKEKGL